MATEKLYHLDSYLTEFKAKVLKVVEYPNNHWGVVLDRTAFYPESGGQPFDLGTIDGVPVIAVNEAEDEIVHLTEGCPKQGLVHGKINWARRFDHMQQHSGEHILSAAFEDIFQAKNIGFHIGEDYSTIDLDIKELSDAGLGQVEQYANSVVFGNRQVSSTFLEQGAIEGLNMRKAPAKEFAVLRIVEMESCDCCPCGGTHVARTGEIGLIKIRSWERKKGGVRINFVCGGRALVDYQLKNNITGGLAALLSSPVEDLFAACERQVNRAQSLHKELAQVKREKNSMLAESLWGQAEEVEGVKLVTLLHTGLEQWELNELATHLTSGERSAALLIGLDESNNKSNFVFACTLDLPINMNQELKKVLALVDGRGGGKPNLAQGGCNGTDNLDRVLDTARNNIIALLIEKE